VNSEDRDVVELRCPTCGRPLVRIGSREVGIGEADFHRRHAYGCSAGCRGPEPDGTFEFIECPVCGSPDTFCTPRGDGSEEVECHACGTITSLQTVPRVP
jgi:ribosomal protein S27E